MQKLKTNLSYLAIALVSVVCVWNVMNIRLWNDTGVLTWDANMYYSYFPTLLNANLDSLRMIQKKFPATEEGLNFLLKGNPQTRNGHQVIKTSMGLAILFIPFYLAGFVQHYLARGSPGNGYEVEYLRTMAFFGMACLIAALFIIRRILKPYFSEPVVALTLLAIALGTNAFYYSDYEGCMTHVPDLMLYALFILLTSGWYAKPNTVNSVLLGLSAGLVILIRPSNAVLSVVFILYDMRSLKEFPARIRLFLSEWHYIAIMGLMVIIVWLPQMYYWYHLTGHCLYYSYTTEHFDFLKPQVLNGLLSWKKGWLIYTPLGWLMLIGFIPMRRFAPRLVFCFAAFILFHWYIIYSWWCWYYGGSYSCRTMVEAYAVLAFPLASLFEWVYDAKTRPKVKVSFSVLLLLIVALNLFQTYQYTHGFIHYSEMTFAAYKSTFLQLHYIPDSLLAP